jgi:uncharacterized protein
MWTNESLVIVGLTFFLAGLVKGVVGLGLPTVSLALLTAAFGLKPAMALMVFPSLATNAWQAIVGGRLFSLLRRLWLLLVMVCAGTWIGVGVLVSVRVEWLTLLLGTLLVWYSLSGLVRPAVSDLRQQEGWLSPVVGAVNGFLTGLTGSFVVPGVLYLQALRLGRDELIQAMGILFTVSTAALGLALGGKSLMDSDLTQFSILAVIPAIGGMVAGLAVRQRLSEAAFRKVLFGALLVLGAYISLRAGLHLRFV